MHADSLPFNISTNDLNRCHEILGLETWRELTGQRIFITGGTGFVGKWLLATLIDANVKLRLSCQITVLSRDPESLLREWPSVRGRVKWVVGDVRNFSLDVECFDTAIHAATDVIAQASSYDVFSTCVEGTKRVLELVHRCKARRLLLVSSGAIYGPLPLGMTHVPETYLGGPNPLLAGSAYGEGKRVAEWLTAQAASNQLEVKIARVFALVGPHIALDKQFAIGNFIRAAIYGEDIVIQGDGTPYRSYLYAADMAAWIWAILLKGSSGEAYNVGSMESISIANLAERVCGVLASKSRIKIKGHSQHDVTPSLYVPDCRKARSYLDIAAPMKLDEAIQRTAKWYAIR